MNLLIAGGAGFIGSNFVNLLFEGRLDLEFETVTVLDALTYAGNINNISRGASEDPRFTFIQGDICNESLVSHLVSSANGIVNFAAESHVDRSIADPSLFFETNVKGTLNILNAMKVSALSPQRLLQVSTDEVYGSVLSGSWVEDSPLEPNSPYSASKASADLLLRAFHKTYGLDLIITRCSNNYGPHQFPEKIIPYFVKLLLNGKKIPIYGDGLQRREWIHVTDHCRGIARALNQGKAGSIYHFGSGDEYSNIELSNLILHHLGLDQSYLQHVPDRPGHDVRYSLDYAKSYAELDFSNSVDFSEGFPSTIDWFVQKFEAAL
jgi:dTDP-glucose 4,6-dehydratase